MVVPIRCSPVVGASEASMAAGGQIEIGGTLATLLLFAGARKKEKGSAGGERREENVSSETVEFMHPLKPSHVSCWIGK